jgi:SAM-dependent methyltransferase
MTAFDATAPPGALERVDHPWGEAALAELYDVFPFAADLPLYLELAAAQGGEVLELCCGSGRLLAPLAQAGHSVVGLDASEPMLALARRKLEAAGSNVQSRARLVQGDIREFDLGQRFDLAIIAVNSFTYLVSRADQQRALACVAAHLRPGGLLAMDLFHPSPSWLAHPPGSLRQDLLQHDAASGLIVARTETVVSTDLVAQVRTIRSAYELVARDGSLTKRYVEWPFRYTFRHEAEHLLERAGFEIDALYGGHRREPFASDSRLMLFLARRASGTMEP